MAPEPVCPSKKNLHPAGPADSVIRGGYLAPLQALEPQIVGSQVGSGHTVRRRRSDSHELIIGAAVPLLALAVVPGVYLLASVRPVSISAQVLLIGIAALSLGLAGWILAGGRVISAAATWWLVTAMFVGGSAILLTATSTQLRKPHLDALAAAHLANVLTWIVWYRRSQTRAPGRIDGQVDIATARYILWGGVALVFTGLVASLLPIDPLPRAFTYGGAIAVGVAAFFTPRRALGGSRLFGHFAAVSAVYFYLAFFFDGGGRVFVAGLAISVLVVRNWTRPRYWHKVLVLAAVVPGLIYFGVLRDDRATVEAVVADGAGLGSFYSPLKVFGDLVEGDREPSAANFPRQYGRTTLETAVFWIPRELWPEKPFGFGARLAETLRPDLRPPGSIGGHSMAALAYGQWYVELWWFGLVAMGLLGGWILGWMDAWQRRLSRLSELLPGDLVSVTLLAIFIGALPNYAWGGSFSPMPRAGTAALVVAGWLLLQRSREPNSKLHSSARSRSD